MNKSEITIEYYLDSKSNMVPGRYLGECDFGGLYLTCIKGEYLLETSEKSAKIDEFSERRFTKTIQNKLGFSKFPNIGESKIGEFESRGSVIRSIIAVDSTNIYFQRENHPSKENLDKKIIQLNQGITQLKMNVFFKAHQYFDGKLYKEIFISSLADN